MEGRSQLLSYTYPPAVHGLLIGTCLAIPLIAASWAAARWLEGPPLNIERQLFEPGALRTLPPGLPSEPRVFRGLDGKLRAIDTDGHVHVGEDAEDFTAKMQHARWGMQLCRNEAGNLVVVKVLRDRPAAKSGIQVGDVIESIDGASVADKPLDDVVRLLKESQAPVLGIVRADHPLRLQLSGLRNPETPPLDPVP